jgi:hypothetical protein
MYIGYPHGAVVLHKYQQLYIDIFDICILGTRFVVYKYKIILALGSNKSSRIARHSITDASKAGQLHEIDLIWRLVLDVVIRIFAEH